MKASLSNEKDLHDHRTLVIQVGKDQYWRIIMSLVQHPELITIITRPNRLVYQTDLMLLVSYTTDAQTRRILLDFILRVSVGTKAYPKINGRQMKVQMWSATALILRSPYED